MECVFINYRRSDVSGHAGRLYDRLASHFGADRIFMDVTGTGIEPGADLVSAIRAKIASSQVVLAVIGRDWMTVSEDGKPRLQNPGDVVRLEIETALQCGVPVIPTLVGGASLPAASELPASLQQLITLQALEIDEKRFHHDIQRLIQAVAKYTPPPPSPGQARDSLWVRAGAAFVVLATCILPVLLFTRVWETDLALEVKSAEVSFEIPKQQILFESIALKALGVSGLEKITITGVREVPATAVRIEAIAGDRNPGSIVVASLTVPGGTRVWVQHHLGNARGFRVSINGKGLDFNVNAFGSLEIGLATTSSQRLTYMAPQQIRFHPDRSSSEEFVDLDFSLREALDEEFSRSIRIQNLSFTRVENPLDSPRATSAILGGTVFVNPSVGRERQLRQGDWIRFDACAGEMRQLKLSSDGITVQFRGYTRGMNTGSDADHENLMPTYFEWLRARHSQGLLLALAIHAAALIVVAQRWRRTHK